MASPSFQPGRPGEAAIDVTRLLERAFRDSRAIDQEALCVLAGHRVRQRALTCILSLLIQTALCATKMDSCMGILVVVSRDAIMPLQARPCCSLPTNLRCARVS